MAKVRFRYGKQQKHSGTRRLYRRKPDFLRHSTAIYPSNKKKRTRTEMIQYCVPQTVSLEKISLYWEIGRRIVEQQQGWGKSVVKHFADELRRVLSNSTGHLLQ